MTRTLRPPIVSVLMMLLLLVLLPVTATLAAASEPQESGPVTSMKTGDGLSEVLT